MCKDSVLDVTQMNIECLIYTDVNRRKVFFQICQPLIELSTSL